MLKIYTVSLGCPKNRVDTEKTLAFLGNITCVSAPERADLIFVNTCGFITPAVEESIRTILEQASTVASINTHDHRPLLIVAGCMVGRYGEAALSPDLPEVDLFLDSKNIDDWGELIVALLKEKNRTINERTVFFPRLLSTGPAYAWLKISEGCRHACTFCTIPSIRGKLQSVPADAVLSEATFLLEQGVKELVLVAQDVTAWGQDAGTSLVYLLEKLLPLSGLHWLRLLYLYPSGMSKELLHFLRSAGRPFLPSFDMPIQHASPHILSRMGRPFAKNPQEAVDRIRNIFPEAALRTSIIVGFPGETEDDFSMLYRFVEETRFHNLGVFAYEAEDGTSAATMKNQIPEKLKEERRGIIMQLQAGISEDILSGYVGRVEDILVEKEHEEWPGLHTGRTWFQAPEIDGVTYISGKGTVPGEIVQADIVDSGSYDLTALTEEEEDSLILSL